MFSGEIQKEVCGKTRKGHLSPFFSSQKFSGVRIVLSGKWICGDRETTGVDDDLREPRAPVTERIAERNPRCHRYVFRERVLYRLLTTFGEKLAEMFN